MKFNLNKAKDRRNRCFMTNYDTTDQGSFVFGDQANCCISIDTITFIYDKTTLLDVVRLLKLEDSFVFSDVKFGLETIGVVNEAYTLTFNDVRISIPKLEVLLYQVDLSDEETVCSHVFSGIRVNLSGSGMRFLRQNFGFQNRYSFDFYLLHELGKIRDNVHLTRIDIALDFINFDFKLVDNLAFDFLTDKVIYSFNGQPMKVDVNCSHRGLTCYVGSKNSDKRLRVYDKYLQQTVEDGVWKLDESPFDFIELHDIESWQRVELQLRNDLANVWLPISKDQSTFLDRPELFIQYLVDNFVLREQWWYAWWKPIQENCSKIIQNGYSTHVRDFEEVAAANVSSRGWSAIVYCLNRYGIDGFIQLVNNGLKARQSVPGKKGFLAFVQKVNSVGLSLADLKYLSLDADGHYILDIDKLLKG